MLKIDAKFAEIETKLASRKGKPSYIYFLLAAYSFGKTTLQIN